MSIHPEFIALWYVLDMKKGTLPSVDHAEDRMVVSVSSRRCLSRWKEQQ